jgi:hypothetical protein
MSVAIKATQKKYCSRALFTAIIFGLPFILGGYAPIGKGLILGALFSIINFILIGETLPMKIGAHSGKRIFAVSLGLLLVRFGLLAIPVVMAIKLDQFHLVTVVIGLFMVQLSIMTEHVLKFISLTRVKRI